MALLDRRQRPGLPQSLLAELPQRLQQPVPRLVGIDHLHHGPVDQIDHDTCGALEAVGRRSAHDFGGFEVEAAGEGRQVGESLLVGRIEQLVRPLHEPVEAVVSRVEARPLAGEQGEALIEAVRQGFGPDRAHPRGGQLDGQWQPVELATDLRRRRHVALVELEARPCVSGSVSEQPHRGGGPNLVATRAGRRYAQGREHVDELAGQAQRRPTGRQHGQSHAATAEALHQGNDGTQDVLAVVEHEQHRPVVDELLDRPLQREMLTLLDIERARDELDGGIRVAQGGQLDHDDLGEAGSAGVGDRHRQSGLADTSRSHDGDDGMPVELLPERRDVVGATDELRRLTSGRWRRRGVRRLLDVVVQRRIVGEDASLQVPGRR